MIHFLNIDGFLETMQFVCEIKQLSCWYLKSGEFGFFINIEQG